MPWLFYLQGGAAVHWRIGYMGTRAGLDISQIETFHAPARNLTMYCAAIPQLGCVWNVMTHVQKLALVFRRNGGVHLNRRGRQFSWLLAAEVCASALVMLDTPCSEVVWEYWQPTPFASFPFTSPPVSLCAIRFQTHSTTLHYPDWLQLPHTPFRKCEVFLQMIVCIIIQKICDEFWKLECYILNLFTFRVL